MQAIAELDWEGLNVVWERADDSTTCLPLYTSAVEGSRSTKRKWRAGGKWACWTLLLPSPGSPGEHLLGGSTRCVFRLRKAGPAGAGFLRHVPLLRVRKKSDAQKELARVQVEYKEGVAEFKKAIDRKDIKKAKAVRPLAFASGVLGAPPCEALRGAATILSGYLPPFPTTTKHTLPSAHTPSPYAVRAEQRATRPRRPRRGP